MNTANKKENQIIAKNIDKDKDTLFEKDEFNDQVIQPQQRADLKYTIDFILDFNEELKQIWFECSFIEFSLNSISLKI